METDTVRLADEFGPPEYVVDRTGWPAGVWDSEPDELEWKDEGSGLKCRMMRHALMGHWCGWVGIHEGHRLFGVETSEIEMSVHGGLTTCGWMDGDQGTWWLGFDCGHAYDFCPAKAQWMKLWKRAGRNYKTVEFVKAECAKLAGQLK